MKKNYAARLTSAAGNTLLIVLFAIGFSNNSCAQGVLAQYTFTGTATCATGSSYTQATVTPAVSTWLTFSEYTRAAACTCNTATAGVYASSNWSSTFTSTKYHEFGIPAVAAGRIMTLTSINVTHNRSAGAGSTTCYLRSSVDGYLSDIATFTTSTTSATATLNLPAGTFANRTTGVTFRLYATASNAGHIWYNDNVTINGVVTATSSAGTSQTICLGTPSVTLAANSVSGTNSYPNPPGAVGTWIQQSGPAPVAFGSVNNPATTVTGFTLTGLYILRWAVTHTGSINHLSQSTVSIQVNNPSTPPPLNIYALDIMGNPIPSNPTICEFTQVDFYVNAPFVNVVPNTYTWKVNGVPMLVQNNVGNYFATSYSASALANNDIVTLEVNWPGACITPNPRISQSEQFTVTPNQPPLVSILHNFPTDTICRGNQVTFTATPSEAGTPTYQWYLDGGPVGTAGTYTTLPTLSVGTHNIWCVIASSEPCDSTAPVFNNTATSQTITLVVNPCYYYVPASGTQGPFYSCGSPFYDSVNDLPVNYSSNVNGLVKICPAVASQYVTISFTSINLNDSGDRLRIFSGTPSSSFTADTSGVALFNMAGPTNSAGCGSVITSNVSGGCLTSHFRSDFLGTAAGWVSNVTCSPTPSAGPLPGSTCSNPTVISALPYNVTSHTTQCYGADYTSQTGICNTLYTGEDRVYQYTATGPECTSITLSGTSGTPTLAVYTGCPGTVGTVCLTPAPQSGNSTAQVTFPSAGTYYIIVDNAGGPAAFSSYNLNIQSFGLAPANDLPCNAQYLDLLVNANGNNSCTGSASEPGNPVCWTGGTLNTAWYSFTSPAAPNPSAVHIRTTPGTITETQIALYSGNCNSLTMIACNQAGPSCASTPNPASSDIVYSNLTPNTVYYIRVDGRNNQTGNYSIIVADVNSPQQPYSDGQDCFAPMSLCNSSFQVGDPGFVSTGWVCDFGTVNNTCMFAGERSSAWYVFTTNGTGLLSWLLTPNGGNIYVDYDWILMDITSFGPDQATRVANACPQINANNLPWVRCNISDVILFAPCATSQYQTGMCPSSTVTTTTPLGPSFCSSLPVVAGQTFLLKLSNWTNNQRGFTIDFNAFGVSPIAYSNPPSVLYWTAGANTTDWFNPVNWGNCGPPNCNTTAIITTGSSFMPAISAAGAVCRDLDIKAGASVTINSNFQLDICRNYVNNGTLNAMPNSTVRVMGTGAQYFDGNMIGSSAFHTLWMNKTSNHMTILDHANVAGNLTLGNVTGGKIITNTKTLYSTNTAPGSVTSGGPGSYVEGNLRRNLSGSAGIYYWPVGTAAKGFQLAATEFYGTHSIGNILSFFTGTAIPVQPGPLGPECPTNDFTTMAPLNNGYWTMTANTNASSATYKMTLFNLNYTNSSGANAWTVLKANTAAGPWTLSGNCIASTATATARDNMSGFSVFTSGQSGAPLPVDLLNFDAAVDGENVLTTWTTATEVNNDYFVIERSADGVNFEMVGTKKGSGNSSVTLYYSMFDTKPLKGVSYYRLRQVDFDGTDSKSHLVAVSFTDENVLSVFPNPAQTSNINIRFIADADGKVELEIMDMLGKIYKSEVQQVTKGLNVFNEYDISDLPQGAYFIRLKPEAGDVIQPMQARFIKQAGER